MSLLSIKNLRLSSKAVIFILFVAVRSHAQDQPAGDSVLQNATLENVVQYAIKHQPLVQQSRIDEITTNYQIKSKLADWYPQVTAAYNIQRNLQLPTTIFAGNATRVGVTNVSTRIGDSGLKRMPLQVYMP